MNYKYWNENTLELCGLITDGSDSEIRVAGDTLVDEIENKLCLEDNDTVTVKYYISNEPIDPKTVVEDFLTAFYGDTEISGIWLCGSEWTGVYGKDDIFKVGGHDIINELYRNRKSYCYIKIQKNG